MATDPLTDKLQEMDNGLIGFWCVTGLGPVPFIEVHAGWCPCDFPLT